MSPAVQAIYAPERIVMARLERLTRNDARGLSVAWEDTTIKEDVDEFFRCLIVLADRRMDPQWYQWWIHLETYYLEHKLKMYEVHLTSICRDCNIRENRKNHTFSMYWSAAPAAHLPAKKLLRLATQGTWPVGTVEKARAHVQEFYSHVAVVESAPEMWTVLGEAIARHQAAQMVME